MLTDFLRSASDEAKLGVGLLVLMGVILGMWLVRWWNLRPGTAYNSSRRLWHELRRAHRLSAKETRLLVRVAHAERIPEPCDLFIEPNYLQRAARMAEFSNEQAELASLAERLFGH